MKKRILIIVGVIIAGAAVWAELSYFRFHTYFQRTIVQETLPPIPSGSGENDHRTLVEGSFVEVDAIHKGSGTARIVTQGGRRYLVLGDFNVTNGPDLYVYLSESRTPGATLQSLGRFTDLGPLKGNTGNQVYQIPDGIDGYNTAIIWCREFSVLFSFAVME